MMTGETLSLLRSWSRCTQTVVAGEAAGNSLAAGRTSAASTWAWVSSASARDGEAPADPFERGVGARAKPSPAAAVCGCRSG
jgi:hypothetical protein